MKCQSQILLLKAISGIHGKRASYLGFRATFADLIVLNYWLTEIVYSLIATYFELSCQSKATDTMDDYAKDGGEQFLPRCTAFFNRIPTESLRIRIKNAMRLSKKSSPPSLA